MLGFTTTKHRAMEPVKAAPRRNESLETIVLEMIGREHCGKTALKTCYVKGPLAGPQPSGLELTGADPRIMTGWMIESLQCFRDLGSRGLFSTLEPEVFPFHLYSADEPRAVLQLRESIGQILTSTTEKSDKAQQELFGTYVQNLGKADVLQVMVACPATTADADMSRFQIDLMNTNSYLREALRQRDPGRPVAVQVLLTKIDVPFADEGEARKALINDRLLAMLARLVVLIEGSAKVGMGAIFPVSAFGFGTTVAAERESTHAPLPGLSHVSAGEQEYLLKPESSPAPFNLTAAVWWALMAGLMLKPVDNRGEGHATTARLMAADIEAMDAWYVPLKTTRG